MSQAGQPALARKALRTLFKKHLNIGYGGSNKGIESRLRTACHRSLHDFDVASRLALVQGDAIPWLSAAKLDEMCAGVLAGELRGPIIAAPAKKRHRHAMGFDFFWYLRRAEVRKLVSERIARRPKKRKGETNLQQVARSVAYAQWRKLSVADKSVYASHAAGCTFVRRRSIGGWWERVPKEIAEQPAELVPGVDAKPAEAVREEPVEPVIVTPRKRRPGIRAEVADRMVQSLTALLDEDGTPEKQTARTILTEVMGDDPQIKKFLTTSCGPFRMKKKPAGRPRGSMKVSDEQLIQSLASMSDPVPDISSKTGDEIRTLHMSKRRSADATKLLKKVNSRSDCGCVRSDSAMGAHSGASAMLACNGRQAHERSSTASSRRVGKRSSPSAPSTSGPGMSG